MALNKKVKLPTKKTMNLYQPDTKNDPKRIISIAAIVFVLAAALLGRFVVYEGILEIRQLQEQADSLNAKLLEMQTETQNYNEVKEKYYRYSESYSKDKEQLVNRIDIIELLSEATKDIGTVNSTSISQNDVSIKLVTTGMDKVAELRKILEENPVTENVIVYSAERSTGDVVATISFSCVLTEGE